MGLLQAANPAQPGGPIWRVLLIIPNDPPFIWLLFFILNNELSFLKEKKRRK